MFCLRESQGDSQPHAPMQEWLMRGSQSQSPPRILQTPITISHTSTNGEHNHHQPRRLVQQKTTYNNPPTNGRWWPQCNLAPTHQRSLPWPMHNRMGPLPPWMHCQDLEMSNRPLLLRTKTGSPFQPNTLGPQNNWPSMDNLSHHLALQKWRTVWEKLRRTMNYRITHYMRISTMHLPPVKGSSFRRRFQHSPRTTNQRGHEMDEMPPGCIPSNSRSVLGAKRWPRLSPLLPFITTCVVAIAGMCMIAQ
jgi:hypothetical protein